ASNSLAQSLINAGTSAQNAGAAGMFTGAVAAAAGASVGGVGSGPGLLLVTVSAGMDATGTLIRGAGAFAAYYETRNPRPMVDTLVGALGGRLANDLTRPLVNKITDYSLDRGWGNWASCG